MIHKCYIALSAEIYHEYPVYMMCRTNSFIPLDLFIYSLDRYYCVEYFIMLLDILAAGDVLLGLLAISLQVRLLLIT